jgi:hypothetical protein
MACIARKPAANTASRCGPEPFKGSDKEAFAFVVDANLRRRHLNESQRAMLAARLETHALDLGYTKIIVLAPITWLAGTQRYTALWQQHRLVRVWVFSPRQTLWRGDDDVPDQITHYPG